MKETRYCFYCTKFYECFTNLHLIPLLGDGSNISIYVYLYLIAEKIA